MEVRVYCRDDVELALLAVEEGMSRREAAEMVGCGETALRGWLAGRLPHSCLPSARIEGKERREGASMCPRGVYDPPARGPLAGLEPAQIENILLRAVLADLKAGGWGPGSISNGSKCELGERLRLATGLPLRSIIGFLRISRSSYEYHRARLGRDRYAALRAEVRDAFEAGRGCYGYRRVHAELRRRGTRVSEKVVRRLMREEGLEARRPRRRRWSSYEGEPDERPANAPRERAEARRARGEDFPPDHDFSASAPGELVVTDVTELAMDGYKCYLSPVVDCYDGMPVSWSLSLHPDSALCGSSLRSCLDSLPPGSAPTVHTDGGGPYRSASWKALCSERGVTRSMSRPGRSGDNAPAEGFFGTFKTEFLGAIDRSGVGLEELAGAVGDYMEWYRDGRLKRFEEPGGGHRYETIAGRRRRLGVAL